MDIARAFDVDPLALLKRAGHLPGVDVDPAPMPPPQVDPDAIEKTVVDQIPGASRKSIQVLQQAVEEIIEIEENR